MAGPESVAMVKHGLIIATAHGTRTRPNPETKGPRPRFVKIKKKKERKKRPDVPSGDPRLIHTTRIQIPAFDDKKKNDRARSRTRSSTLADRHPPSTCLRVVSLCFYSTNTYLYTYVIIHTLYYIKSISKGPTHDSTITETRAAESRER